MIDLPIRSLTVSDFRRIQGTRVLPFDAPVVLIHGSNGAGKTSVLSALELALTGSIRSMQRQDGYATHLPFLGQSSATVRAEVSAELQAGSPEEAITVHKGRLDGNPALPVEAAKFYGERCYLDQASLGRLLELYQYREGKEESALARFVSELLGLEKLDALRTGLYDATDLRLLKKMAKGVDDAGSRAKLAANQLTESTAALLEARRELHSARDSMVAAMEALHPSAGNKSDRELLAFVHCHLRDDSIRNEAVEAEQTNRALTALGAHITALIQRPSMHRMADVQAALDKAVADLHEWTETHDAVIQSWDSAAEAIKAKLPGEHRDVVRKTAARVRADLEADATLKIEVGAALTQMLAGRDELAKVQNLLTDAHVHSSALIEGLVLLRGVIKDDNCPVCDRDYAETDHRNLSAHIDEKLGQLTVHRGRLIELSNERDDIAAQLTKSEVRYSRLSARLMSADEHKNLENRHYVLCDLVHQLDTLEPALASGRQLQARREEARETLDSIKSAASEDRHVRAELARFAKLLRADASVLDGPHDAVWKSLVDRSNVEVTRLNNSLSALKAAAMASIRFEVAIDSESAAAQAVADAQEDKARWEACVAEIKRRQTVAKEVHEAATHARTTVVQRVFTESLNDVWRSVFTRLAPNEGFIPRFGIPTASKAALDIKLETRHRSGDTGGSPQMMLSAGNLNTAALSLFLALHLAVQPAVPCLVFDDPVQAMDEVHVAQFAGLIRVLAKQHQRQVVIAVHERELFEYLALELSPAYEGDELITIELGERAKDMDGGITRHTWSPDLAIQAGTAAQM